MKHLSLFIILIVMHLTSFSQTYTMPHENEPHEGTWLQWPHQFEYGVAYRNSLDATWTAMTKALAPNEKVHIIAYNTTEKTRIGNLLTAASVPTTNVDYFIFQTNDVWIRDNGPIFVRDAFGSLKIEDYGFNGWGTKYNFAKCNIIPNSIGTAISMPVVNLNTIMTNEGGAVELDGNGVLLACKSSIISQTPANSIRNPGMTQTQAETIFTQYLGTSKYIWLNGNVGDPNDVTDFHIDGFAKFVSKDTLVTMNNADLTYWGTSPADIATLYAASNISNVVYAKVYLPLTQNNVVTTAALNLGYKGSYVNYYVANNAVLVPNYNDPNDAVANAIIQTLYPGRTVTGIDCRNLYENGGMVHCVTQQQPVSSISSSIKNNFTEAIKVSQIFPNPFNSTTNLNLTLQKSADIQVLIYNSVGQLVSEQINSNFSAGNHLLTIESNDLQSGVYTYVVKINKLSSQNGRMVIMKN